jgi:hypothetical protein
MKAIFRIKIGKNTYLAFFKTSIIVEYYDVKDEMCGAKILIGN